MNQFMPTPEWLLEWRLQIQASQGPDYEPWANDTQVPSVMPNVVPPDLDQIPGEKPYCTDDGCLVYPDDDPDHPYPLPPAKSPTNSS